MIKYYLIDLTKPSKNGFLTSAASVHKNGANQAELSITENVAGTLALVKVKGDQSALQKPDPQNLIIEEYTEAEMKVNFLPTFYTSEWQISE